MDILITNLQLMPWQGSEVATYTIGSELVRRGHTVTVCSRYVERETMLPWFKGAGIRVVLDPMQVREERFDICHAHHNVMAESVRTVFPKLPMVFMSHGILPFPEQPPIPDTNIGRYIGVSEEVATHLQLRTDTDVVQIVRNPVDSVKFSPNGKPADPLRRVLVLSNKMPEDKLAVVEQACSAVGAELHLAGGANSVAQDDLPAVINNADVVVSLGRGVIETMMCGRVPVVYDYQGGDGMVVPRVVEDLARCNFSGRVLGIDYTVSELTEILRGYRQTFGLELREKAVEMFDAIQQVDKLEAIYREVIDNGA